MSLTILDILDLNELGSYFTLYFDITIQWYDARLKYQFLKVIDEEKDLGKS